MTYLAKFSQLMRNILENSRKTMISLEDEISTLKLYMELEAMRFSNSFEYRVNLQDELIPSRIYIPPMLVQPFVENSIKHGFRDRHDTGRITIEFARNNGTVTCTIQDNGIGREKSMALRNSGTAAHKSLGMQVTHERLIAMKKDRNLNVKFNIEDLVAGDGKPAGTRVVLDMPYETE
jgi:LytS/YehU family sensor histidine kinase